MFKRVGKLIVHYHREDADYSNWALWLWEFTSDIGKEFEFSKTDSFGAVGVFSLSNWSNFALINNIGLIVKSKGSWAKKDGSDRIIKFYKMVPDKKGNFYVYIKENDNELYANEKLERISTFAYARFKDFKTVEVKANDLFDAYSIKCNKEVILTKDLNEPVKEIEVQLSKEISLDNDYVIEVKLNKNGLLVHRHIRFSPLYKLNKFHKLFSYDGELGALVEKDSTTFKVWSPISRKITLKVYKNGTPTYFDHKLGSDEVIIEQDMVKEKNGVFSLKINKNLHGFYYTYVVTNDSYKAREIVDIYAKSTGINGMRGMIVDFSKIDSVDLSKIKIHPYNPRSLTVYEAHIADITSSATWTSNPEIRKFEKTFLGACLKGTTYKENGIEVKTGFDHIKELGVNAVQLLPIFDQANNEAKMTFNWGYNPVNYNTLEGGYSTNPSDGIVRIKEFKELIKKYHDAGINIIMDVVYNHLNGAVGSSFDVLMPGYFFRYNKEGNYSNGSGCGNETASEMPMYRKFMIDSVLFWAKEYKLGGFRFDLMAIHDIETMNLLVKKLHEFDKNIVVYGEPWTGAGSMLSADLAASKANGNHFKGYGFFNDCIRDSLIRTNKDRIYSGWCANSINESRSDQSRIIEGIKGISYDVKDPNKVVNYASCHDNMTLRDRIVFDGITSEKDIKRIAMLANSIVLTSNGISFILSGEEFLRSKGGCDNSYNSSYKVNELDYSLKIKNIDMFKNYQKLIHLKKNCNELSLDKGDNESLKIDGTNPNMISYELHDYKDKKLYKVFHLNGLKNSKPLLVNLEGYNLYMDSINSHKELSNSTLLIPFETLIAFKKI